MNRTLKRTSNPINTVAISFGLCCFFKFCPFNYNIQTRNPISALFNVKRQTAVVPQFKRIDIESNQIEIGFRIKMNCKLVKYNCIQLWNVYQNTALIVIAIVIILGVNRGVCTPHLKSQIRVKFSVPSTAVFRSLSPPLFFSLCPWRHSGMWVGYRHTYTLICLRTFLHTQPWLDLHWWPIKMFTELPEASYVPDNLSYNSSSLQLEHSSDEVQERAVLQAPTTVRERWRSAFDFTAWLVLMNVSWHRDSEGSVWTCARKRDRWVQDLSGII